MRYVVQPGDSLSTIAARRLGNAARWPEIAQRNRLRDPSALLVGQVLDLPDGNPRANPYPPLSAKPLHAGAGGRQTAQVPANYYLFILADEINPLRAKAIRRVIVNPALTSEFAGRMVNGARQFPDPARWGFRASDPHSPLPVGRHAQGIKPSPYVSASRQAPFGATRFAGKPFYIDEIAARRAGATFHDAGEITRDLQRIVDKTKDPASRARLIEIMRKVNADREVLIRGSVSASAVKGLPAMALTRSLQGVQIIGFAMTAVDMKHAADKSIGTGSAKPIAAETIRQAGGWAAAWAGMKLGGAGGALLGIETGPGAIVTGLIGGAAGGVAGYYGFDWIADKIDPN